MKAHRFAAFLVAALASGTAQGTCPDLVRVFDATEIFTTPPGCSEMLVKIWGGGAGLPFGATPQTGNGGGGAVIARYPISPASETHRRGDGDLLGLRRRRALSPALPGARPAERWEENPLRGWKRNVASPANFLDWRD